MNENILTLPGFWLRLFFSWMLLLGLALSVSPAAQAQGNQAQGVPVYYHSFAADAATAADGPGTTDGAGGTLVDVNGGTSSISGGSLLFQPHSGTGFRTDALELPQTFAYQRSSQSVRLRFVYHLREGCDRCLKLCTQANHTTFYMPLLTPDGHLYLFGVFQGNGVWGASGNGAAQNLTEGKTYDFIATASADIQGINALSSQGYAVQNMPNVTLTAALYPVDGNGVRSVTPQAPPVSYYDVGYGVLASGGAGITGDSPGGGAGFSATEFEVDDTSSANPAGQQFYMLTGTTGTRNVPYELYVPSGTQPSFPKRLVVFNHGFQNNGTNVESQIRIGHAIAPLLPALLAAGYLVICSAEDGNPWGNDVSVQDMADSVSAVKAGFTVTGVHLYGLSMGGLPTALAVLGANAACNGTSIAGLPILSATFNCPVLDLAASHDGTGGSYNFGYYIDAAYGGSAGYNAALPTHSPLPILQKAAPLAIRVPTRFYAESDDVTVAMSGNTTPFAAALAASPFEHGVVTVTGGHASLAAIDATRQADLFAFLARAESAPAPLALTVSHNSSGQPTLTWTPDPLVRSYAVQRSTDGGAHYTTIAGGVTTNTYTDTAEPTGTVLYHVSDRDVTDVGATPSGPATPSNLAATTKGGWVTLTWNAVSGATGYRLYKDGATTPLFDGTAQAYTDTVALSSTHSYQVSAYNATGESAKSAPVSVTTSPAQ